MSQDLKREDLVLIGRVMPENTSATNFSDFRCGFGDLARLLDAARDEERERQERMRCEEEAEREPPQAEGAPAAESLHPATRDLVQRFNAAVSEKLAQAEIKYGYSDGWADPAWEAECRQQLHHHAAKGDPRDVAAYAAFCWHHGWSTAEPGIGDRSFSPHAENGPPPPAAEGKEEVCWRCGGERCIQEGSPEAWNYTDCPECKASGKLSKTPAPAAEPVGDWVMVPREPTEAMTGAMAYRCSQDPGWTVGDAYRDALLAAPSPPAPVAISREEIETLLSDEAVREAMTDAWADICDDSACHPVDIQQLGRKRLTFSPNHWADLTAMMLRTAILSKLSGYPLVEEGGRDV